MINLLINKKDALYSKRIKRKAHEKKKETLITKIKYHSQTQIFFFIDPFLSHRIYRDFLIPNHQFTRSEPICHFKAYLAYKSITQVHIREKGLVIQFNDYYPDYITPMGLLKSRLNSVGNKYCHELAEYLPLYYGNFEEICNYQEEKSKFSNFFIENEPLISAMSMYGKLLEIIDEIFEIHRQDLLLLTVYHGNKAKWLTNEEELQNIFENDLIDQLLQIFTYTSMEHYMQDFTDFVKAFPIKGLQGKLQSEDFYQREINTAQGFIPVKFHIKYIPVVINKRVFTIICSVGKDEEKFARYEAFFGLKGAKGKERNMNKKDWGRLYQCYYQKK